MQARCGAWQVGSGIDRGRVEFCVFFPTGPDLETSSRCVTTAHRGVAGVTDMRGAAV
jgi:hypothetical protein